MKWPVWLNLLVLAALPASNSYQLNSYGFGTGGTADSSSSAYRLNASAGEVAGSSASNNYKVGAGENFVKQANVPVITISNDDSWYNKLKIVIDPQNNPSDATFAIAISTDNFTTTQYVKSDLTIGTTLTTGDYLTYAGWGSATGSMLRGLDRNTTYYVKAKAYRGSFTESPYGPVSSAATFDPQLSFDIDVAPTDTSTSPPYQISFGNLNAGSITTSTDRVWISLATNAESGGKVYVSGKNGGLLSTTSGYTIASSSVNLSSVNEGFGLQGLSATQTSGGPLSLVSPYNGSSQTVGIAASVFRELFTTGSPVVNGRGSFVLKAKSQASTPAAADYTEILTAVAAGNF